MVQETGYVANDEHSLFALSYSIRHFEGPLDLLLHLVQKAQVNIYDIPVAEITDQFLAYLDMARSLNLDDLTDFYAMAAHLIYLKSKMLLPQSDALDEDDEFFEMRTELVERLLEYQKFKRYTALLADSNQSGELFIQRRKSQFMLPFQDQDLWNDVTVWDLLQTFSSLLHSITPEQVFNVYEEVTTKQKITLMAELFESREEISFIDIVVRKESPMDIICAFLALLEAVKFSMITIQQHALFGDIVIRKKDDFNALMIDEADFGDEEPFESFITPKNETVSTDRALTDSLIFHVEEDDIEDDDEIINLLDEED